MNIHSKKEIKFFTTESSEQLLSTAQPHCVLLSYAVQTNTSTLAPNLSLGASV